MSTICFILIFKVNSMSATKQIRAFNRFYTNFLGLVNNRILDSPLSLSESRVLYELAQQDVLPTSQLLSTLQIDKGYLSRILKKFEKERCIMKSPATEDKRIQNLTLTAKGKTLFEFINRQSEEQIERYTCHLDEQAKEELVQMFEKTERFLSNPALDRASVSLKDITIRTNLEPGDMGFVIFSHGELYKKEYNYGIAFEHYVAKGMREFYESYNPERSRVWVCEHHGKRIGFLLLMDRGKTAQLRYFLIDPAYRGIGLGKKLMQLYMDFLKKKEYQSSYLWTTNELPTAASLYLRHGFQLVEEKTSSEFGKPLIEQKYELTL